MTLDATADATLVSRLDRGLASLGISASDLQRERLLSFTDLLARWNRAYNLTAVRDPLEMVPKHLLDSLAVLPRVQPRVHHGPVLDVGTGPGLPGLPLAILLPGLDFTLLDGNGKKVRFVRQVVLELGLDNVEPVHARMQAYRPRVNFATIMARAVAALPDLCRDCSALMAPGGVLLALKGRLPEQEVADLAAALPPRVRGADIAIHPVRVPTLDAARCIIEVPFD